MSGKRIVPGRFHCFMWVFASVLWVQGTQHRGVQAGPTLVARNSCPKLEVHRFQQSLGTSIL